MTNTMQDFKLFLITNNPEMAAYAVSCGVDRIFVDLELLGKHERQGHLDTVISSHTLEDVVRIRSVVPSGQLMVRINPMNESSTSEIDSVVAAGADVIMLPMFTTPAQVADFTAAVAGRARCSLLVETLSAAKHLRECVRVPGVDEVHVGLNDLHLELKMDFMFEPLANGLVDEMATVLRSEGIPFGIGGIARVGEGMLPAELLLAEHVRLGSTAAILSRTFHRQAQDVREIREQMDFPAEIRKLHEAYAAHKAGPGRLLEQCHRTLQENVQIIVDKIASRRLSSRA